MFAAIMSNGERPTCIRRPGNRQLATGYWLLLVVYSTESASGTSGVSSARDGDGFCLSGLRASHIACQRVASLLHAKKRSMAIKTNLMDGDGIMVLTLFDINEKMCAAWEYEFASIADVQIINTDLQNLEKHEYLVTAGNSYGIMDGGIDLAVRNMLGIEIQDCVQWEAVRRYKGVIPIGGYVTVDVLHPKFDYLIYAPTMVEPMVIPSSNVYIVMSTILRDFRNAKSIACCGLGSLAGGLPCEVVAKAMKEAYLDIYGR